MFAFEARALELNNIMFELNSIMLGGNATSLIIPQSMLIDTLLGCRDYCAHSNHPHILTNAKQVYPF